MREAGMRRRQRAGWLAGRRACAVILAAGVLAAGCGSVPAPVSGTAAPGGRAAAAVRAEYPAAGSRSQALVLARQLLWRLGLPPGAHRTRLPLPQGLRRTGGYAVTGAVADIHRLFRLPQPVRVARSFLLAHWPAGMPVSGYSAVSGHTVMAAQDVSFGLRSLPAGIDDAQLVATLVPGRRAGSLLRVDAQVIWFPPRSRAEYLDPPAYRGVTVTVQLLNPRIRTVTRTFTSRVVISRLAGLFDGLHGAPYRQWSCPGIDTTDRLEFVPARPGGHAVVVSPSQCLNVSVASGGRVQPDLWDPDDKLAAAADRLLGLKPHP
jgi:hypothetical protein